MSGENETKGLLESLVKSTIKVINPDSTTKEPEKVETKVVENNKQEIKPIPLGAQTKFDT